MAKIIKVEPLPNRGGEPWIAVTYDDGTRMCHLLRPFEIVPRPDPAFAGALADGAGAAPPVGEGPARRVQLTVVHGGKRA